MSEICGQIHELFRSRTPLQHPVDQMDVPPDGLFAIFDIGEHAHGGNRIVRLGAHRAAGGLFHRIQEHLDGDNKDRSILKKAIGRAILNRRHDPFLRDWNIDLTSRKSREQLASRIDRGRLREIEAEVSAYIRRWFRVTAIPLHDPTSREQCLRRIVGALAKCEECRASVDWLGNWSPDPKIRDSGLWHSQHLDFPPMDESQLQALMDAMDRG